MSCRVSSACKGASISRSGLISGRGGGNAQPLKRGNHDGVLLYLERRDPAAHLFLNSSNTVLDRLTGHCIQNGQFELGGFEAKPDRCLRAAGAGLYRSVGGVFVVLCEEIAECRGVRKDGDRILPGLKAIEPEPAILVCGSGREILRPHEIQSDRSALHHDTPLIGTPCWLTRTGR